MRVCSVEGCNRVHRAKGYCTAHYTRVRTGRDMSKPVQRAKGARPSRVRVADVVTILEYNNAPPEIIALFRSFK